MTEKNSVIPRPVSWPIALAEHPERSGGNIPGGKGFGYSCHSEGAARSRSIPGGEESAFGEVQIQKRYPPPPGKRSDKSPASLRFIPADKVAFHPGANVAAIEKLTCLC